LISPLDKGIEIVVEYFANFAERNLDVSSLIKFLKSPQKKIFNSVNFKDFKIDKSKPIAIAEDKISLKAALEISPSYFLKANNKKTSSKIRIVADACFR